MRAIAIHVCRLMPILVLSLPIVASQMSPLINLSQTILLVEVDSQITRPCDIRRIEGLSLVGTMWIVVTVLFICFVDHHHISRNFALDSSVGPILQSTLLFKIHCSLLDIIDRAPDDLSLFVLIDAPVDIGLLVT